MLLGDMLLEMKRPREAQAAYERALNLAQTVEPEFQRQWIGQLNRKLAAIRAATQPEK